MRYRVMYIILSVIRPAYIIDINWIGKLNYLYLIWCRNHRPAKFIVVQHGLYLGGMITDNAHKYAKCDTILCWGEHSENEFKKYNYGKNLQIIRFGNPLYNSFVREKIHWQSPEGLKVLIAVTVVKEGRKKAVEELVRKLISIGFDVYLKEHVYQSKLSEPIEAPQIVNGDFYKILARRTYNIIICDTSTTLIDSLYFKHPTLYFSPPGEVPEFTNNAYSKYMVNIHEKFKSLKRRQDLIGLIDLKAQEQLLMVMHTPGNNLLTDVI